ncbi:MAG: YdiU family protein [Rhodocyclaceae bacterium]|nr:YdiU family protein [Rhodocyclaceae bacterium]
MNAPDPEFPLRSIDALAFDNSFARLPARFHTRLAPWGLPEPRLVATSAAAAALIGLDPSALTAPEALQWLAGNRLPDGAESLAAVYSGHQFGVWAGRLGDGRAHLAGEVRGAGGPWELQWKGAGRTPYSRMGDGRAVLRSSIREFLCSEAMAGLGIPSTRALAIVGSDLPVQREETETAAVVMRMSPSFVRFGSFEHWAAAGDVEALQILADYVIDRHFPALREAPQPVEALLQTVSRLTGELLAQWQAVGFMHGVMNTDNMSILGLTIDYGPFGFMDGFDGGHVCNHSDSAGRYRFSHQPQVAHWNLLALAGALLPLLDGDRERARAAVDEAYGPAYDECFARLMGAKLGLAAPADEALLTGLYLLLQRNRCDYTSFFRRLSVLPAQVEAGVAGDAPVLDLCIDREAGAAWLREWRTRLAGEARPERERQASMTRSNPKYVLRNWVAESAIRAARQGEFAELHDVLHCLARPFDEQPEFERFATPPPDWADGIEVSCSS